MPGELHSGTSELELVGSTMRTRLLRRLIAALWLGLMGLPALSADDTVELDDIKPNVCSGPFKYNESTKACDKDEDKLKKILDPALCNSTALKWNNDKCESVAGKEPKPTCGTKLANLLLKDGKCVVDRSTPRSAKGQYIGDCFRVIAAPRQNNLGFEVGEHLFVLSQRDEGDDQVLQVAAAKPHLWYYCSPIGPDLRQVRASQLEMAGAERLGWTYGVLTMPFKYYRHDRTFGSSVSLGPYVGRRSGAAGSAITFAVAATIGSVKGAVLDAGGAVTGTPDLMAFSLAAGWMYDISKAPGVKPFKIGVFFGQDRVSRDKVVNFKHNGRGWMAFQIGFDFTDN
jgi:hypothetical protein